MQIAKMNLKSKYSNIIAYFKQQAPNAQTELHYNSPYQLIVAVILSAQCTDVRINKVTPALFKTFPSIKHLALASVSEVFELIKSVSYPNNKANHLVQMAQLVVQKFKGQIPQTTTELMSLPGVGRKTANVVTSVLFNQPTMAVDTHVFRVSNRLGLVNAKTPLACEQQLIKHIPKNDIATAHHWLILHGRYVCKARSPMCSSCYLTIYCDFFNKNLKPKPAMTKTNETAFKAHQTKLKEKQKAPNFNTVDSEGNQVSLSELKDKKVVLYFYPKDDTPGCTLQACSLRDNYKLLLKNNYLIFGVSADDEKSHKKFITKYDLPFPLLLDTDKNIIKAYDVWGLKKMMGKQYEGIFRTTFIIDEKGTIAHIITKVNTENHAQQIMELAG